MKIISRSQQKLIKIIEVNICDLYTDQCANRGRWICAGRWARGTAAIEQLVFSARRRTAYANLLINFLINFSQFSTVISPNIFNYFYFISRQMCTRKNFKKGKQSKIPEKYISYIHYII